MRATSISTMIEDELRVQPRLTAREDSISYEPALMGHGRLTGLPPSKGTALGLNWTNHTTLNWIHTGEQIQPCPSRP